MNRLIQAEKYATYVMLTRPLTYQARRNELSEQHQQGVSQRWH